MCRLETEGTQHSCGHYVITKVVRKVDCNSPHCTHSERHRIPCRDCAHDKFLGPDAKETVTKQIREFCPDCLHWYGAGAAHRR